jgi:hypothetical protein
VFTEFKKKSTPACLKFVEYATGEKEHDNQTENHPRVLQMAL